MDRKAFIFDYLAFIEQLSSLLEEALLTNKTEGLISFIEDNIVSLKDPYEGEPLDSSWEDLMEDLKDVHNYGDFALTKFYDPANSIGLCYDWQQIDDILSRELSVDPLDIILGHSFGPDDNHFNPGRMGSAFQSPEQVKDNIQIIQKLIEQKPDLAIDLKDLLSMLKQAEASEKGLYTTF